MNAAKILTDLVASATGAKTHFEVWWAQASDAKPQLIAVMKDHSDFFRASWDAHYTAFFVYLAHLFDRRADSSSIRTYLSVVKDTLPAATLSAFESRYEALAKRADPVITARHKTVAHIDARLSEKDVFASLNVTWNDVRELIYDSAQFVAEIAGTSDLSAIGIPRDRRLIDSTLRLIRALETSRA